MTHTITVTRVIDSGLDDTDDPEYTIGGTHDSSCSVWYPCKVEGCDADDEGDFHGESHLVIGGIEDYCTRGEGCGLDYSFEYDNPEFQMTQLGVYHVDVEWDGDNWTAALGHPISRVIETGNES